MTSNLVVLTFEGTDTAKTVWTDLCKLEEAGVVEMEDAVIAWRAGPKPVSMASPLSTTAGTGHAMSEAVEPSDHVHIEQTRRPGTGKMAKKGAVVGLVAGLLLGGPIGGLAVGAGLGALGGSMKDYGIDDGFVKEATRSLRPGTSAIFLLGHANDQERLVEDLRTFDPHVMSTTLLPEQEQRLRDRLAS